MNAVKVWVIDHDAGRKNRLVARLSALGFDAAALDSPSRLATLAPADETTALALVALRHLGAKDLERLNRARRGTLALSLVLLAERQDADRAAALLEQGLADQVADPDNWGSVYSTVKGEIARRNLTKTHRADVRKLRRLKASQSENERRAAELEESYTATLENLMTALDLRDVETFGHSLTVARYSCVLAQLLGIGESETLENIRKGALLHDIGKIAIPDSILKKPTQLSAAEWEKIKLHPTLGHGLIKEIKLVKEVGNIILCHHERYDGTGYPRGLKKDAIPLEARIFALADALDAITSHRPYRKERDFQAARKDILEHRGSQFDPRVVDAFSAVGIEEWEKIRFETTKLLPSMESFSALYNKQ